MQRVRLRSRQSALQQHESPKRKEDLGSLLSAGSSRRQIDERPGRQVNTPSMGRPRAGQLAALGLLVLGAFFLRAWSLDAQSLWRDEVDALRFATAPQAEILSNFARPGWNGPLYYLLFRGWIALTGRSEYAMRFFSLIPGVLSIPLVYLLGRRLFNPRAGLISALLVMSSPYLVWYSQEVKMYGLVLALALLAIYSLRRAIEGGGWYWWLTHVAATTLAFYSHILAALLIPVEILLCVAWWPRARARWRGALVSFATLTLPYLPLIAWQAPLALRARETGFTSYSLDQMVVILLNGWSTGIAGWGNPWAAAVMSLLAAGGLCSRLLCLVPRSGGAEARREGIRDCLALLIWLLIPLLSVWLISLRQPLFTDRYLIWSVPAFYLLVALSLTASPSSKHWVWCLAVGLLTIVIIVGGVNVWKQATTPIKSDFRAAAAYVALQEEPADGPERPTTVGNLTFRCYLPIVTTEQSRFEDLIIFQIPHGRYAFDYYFPVEAYSWAEGLYTNHVAPDGTYQMSEQRAAWQMRDMTRGHEEIWLIATEVTMWDERNLVQRWLDENLQRVGEAHFARVDVYRYVARDG